MNNQYMLDTNIVSYLLRGHPAVAHKIAAVPMASLCISVITKGELLFGLAKRPHAKRLHLAVQEFLQRVDTLPWENISAECYGVVRAKLEKRGKLTAPLDLLIAAHALSRNIILITNDQSLRHIPQLSTEDWTVAERE